MRRFIGQVQECLLDTAQQESLAKRGLGHQGARSASAPNGFLLLLGKTSSAWRRSSRRSRSSERSSPSRSKFIRNVRSIPAHLHRSLQPWAAGICNNHWRLPVVGTTQEGKAIACSRPQRKSAAQRGLGAEKQYGKCARFCAKSTQKSPKSFYRQSN